MKIKRVRKLLNWLNQYSYLDYARKLNEECDIELLEDAYKRFLIERSLFSKRVRNKRIYVDAENAIKTCSNCLVPDDDHYCSYIEHCLPEYKLWMKGYSTLKEIGIEDVKSEGIHSEESEKIGNRLGNDDGGCKDAIPDKCGDGISSSIEPGGGGDGNEKKSTTEGDQRDSIINRGE